LLDVMHLLGGCKLSLVLWCSYSLDNSTGAQPFAFPERFSPACFPSPRSFFPYIHLFEGFFFPHPSHPTLFRSPLKLHSDSMFSKIARLLNCVFAPTFKRFVCVSLHPQVCSLGHRLSCALFLFSAPFLSCSIALPPPFFALAARLFLFQQIAQFWRLSHDAMSTLSPRLTRRGLSTLPNPHQTQSL